MLTEWSCELQQLNGIALSMKYNNANSCQMFMTSIASFLLEQNKLEFQSARFLTVFSDTSTGASVIEQETVLVQFVTDGFPKTKMASLMNLDHAHAEGVFNSIDSALDLCCRI